MQLLDTTIIGTLSFNEQVYGALPAANNTLVYGSNVANKMMVAATSSSGINQIMQALMGKSRVVYWNPEGNSTTIPLAFGVSAPTANGTATARTIDTTNVFKRTRRIGYVSAAATNAAAGYRLGTAQFTTGGSSAGRGGFLYTHRFGITDGAVSSNPTSFIGLNSSTAAPANGVANTANCIGVGLATGSNNFQLCYGGSTAQPRIDLGTNFISNTSNDAIFELSLYSPPSIANTSNAIFYYSFSKINTTGQYITSGGVEGGSTILPTSTTLLTLQNWRSQGATTTACGLDLISLYIETDY